MLPSETTNTAKPVVKVLHSHIDWLTVTAISPEARDKLAKHAQNAIQRARWLGLKVRDWHFKGYTGWMSEGFRAGSRQDSDIVMLSGPDAVVYWRMFGALAENCTRIDLAVTAELAEPIATLALDAWAKIPRTPEGKAANGVTYAIILNTKGGVTLYVGSRSSPQFGRFYDKGVESQSCDHPGQIWRYELEIKKPLAREALHALLTHHNKAEVGRVIGATVAKWFEERHIEPLFTGGQYRLELDYEAHVTTDALRLKWISTQVRPTVLDLVDRGQDENVMAALGLTDYIQRVKGAYDVNGKVD